MVREFALQRRRRRIRLLGGGTGGSIAAAVAILATVIGAAAPAFAGWTAVPKAPTRAQMRTALYNCPQRSAPTLTAPTLADARGPYTMLLFVVRGKSELCISGPSFTAVGNNGEAVAEPGSKAIAVNVIGRGTADRHPYTFLVGRAGPGVTAVAIALENGMRVDTTTAHGWFAAWWPGRQYARTALVTARGGVRTQPLPAPRPAPRPR
jgi:hypothetical protein